MKAKYETFESVYCSGFLVDPALLTALCLLFDKVYLLNHLEYVIAFSKRFRFKFDKSDSLSQLQVEIKGDQADAPDPFVGLTKQQRQTAMWYLGLAYKFATTYHELFGTVISSSLFPKDEIFDVQLIEKGVKGKLNKYRVITNPLVVTLGGSDELRDMIQQGAVPVIGKYHLAIGDKPEQADKEVVHLASILAMSSVKLILPQTKAARGETILEARERLRDCLSLFWASMLKMSIELKRRITQDISPEELEKEAADICNSIVRPSLIELNEKLTKDRKNWFHRIIAPITTGLTTMIAKPPVTTADLVTSGIALGTNVAINSIEQLKRIRAASQDSGLTYLIKLDELIRNS